MCERWYSSEPKAYFTTRAGGSGRQEKGIVAKAMIVMLDSWEYISICCHKEIFLTFPS